jgi:spore germination cell wall hydrolase CwlJ-like protein
MIPELFLACTLAFESIGESLHGKQMVASVIVNRMNERKLSAVEVCLQRKQFSCWNNGVDEARVMKQVEKWRRESPDEWADCMELAVKIQNDRFAPIAFITHYYNPKLCSPKWADKLVGKRTVGNHVFGRL